MPRVRFISLLFIAVAAGLTARGKGLALESLLTNDPFGASAGTGRAQTPAGPSLELHGILTEGKTQFFSLYDPASKTAAWVKLDETGQPFVVKAYNAPQESITVGYQGREVTLRLKDERPDGNGAPAASTIAGTRSAEPVISPQFVKAETQRLAGILAEIRRRRVERESAKKH